MFDSVFNEVVTREYQPRNRYTFSRRNCIPLIGVSNFECHKNQAFYLHSCIDAASPPFDCDFSPRKLRLDWSITQSLSPGTPNLLLVAKEDGLVHLFDTEQHGSESLIRYYGVHNNAIFSVKWVTRANQFLTASGDQTIKLVDSETGLVVSVYVGHTMSVRSLALSPEDYHVFASASRDGSIRLWDMRTQNPEGVGSSVYIHGCHLPSFGSSSRRCRSKSRSFMTDSQSVTSVVFAGEFELISAGSTDGAIKIWDIRRVSTFTKNQPQPITFLPYNGISRKQCGYSDLVLDSNRRRLYASCLDHAVYEYDLTSASTRPVLLYTGHLTGSFYIKLSLSPDNAYLVCGSADSRAYIYRVGARTQRPFVLSGHTGEVSVPRWSPHDPTRVVTLSDTAQLFIWRMFPAREYTMPEMGELIGLTERLSQPTVTAEHQRSLLVPASVRSMSVILATKSLPISSESGGGAFGSSSLLDGRRRQLNIRDFLMDLPQVGDVNGSNLISNNGGSRNNIRSSILSSTIAKSYQFLQPNGMKGTLRTTLQIALGPQRITLHTISVFNSTAIITIRVYPGPLGKGGDLGLYLTSPKHCFTDRELRWNSQSSRKRPMKVDDGNCEEMEDHESNIGSQSPAWSKHSTATEAFFSASSSVSMGTGSLRGTPRHRRRTMVSTASSASTLSLSVGF
ncbi:unnamed protein product [Taenia asiatica]|uniref:WD_REPEATS_REGION domain-containing protein n=1 Tax=Taenia asiatica TaxID=60517 RepID=A0A0R3VSF7_TAEAS|nr:unnamed protein product [Taenia asiatica]